MYGETGEPKDGNTKIAGQGHCRTENMECGKELDMQNETDKQILSTLNQDNFQNSSGGKKAAEDDEMGLFSQGFMDRMREMVSEQFGEEAAERFMVQNKDMIKEENINVRVINMSTIKPIDTELIIKAAKETKAIVTAEEHSIIGGLGSAVSEVVSENHPVKVKKVGLNDCFGESGTPGELLEKYGLTAKNIVAKVKEAIQ